MLGLSSSITSELTDNSFVNNWRASVCCTHTRQHWWDSLWCQTITSKTFWWYTANITISELYVRGFIYVVYKLYSVP